MAIPTIQLTIRAAGDGCRPRASAPSSGSAISAGLPRAKVTTAVAGVAMAIPLGERNAQNIAVSLAAARRRRNRPRSRPAELPLKPIGVDRRARPPDRRQTNLQRDLLAPAEGVRNAAQAMFREATDVL